MGPKKGMKAVKVLDSATEVNALKAAAANCGQKAIQKEKVKSEIDEIFGYKKRKKSELEDREESQAAANKKPSSQVVKLNCKGELVKPKNVKSDKEKTVPGKSTSTPVATTSRKKTEDGFTVYSAEELGFNKKGAGGTALCPFDCDCCF